MQVDDGRSVKYGFGELDMLVPAYAATIHKSQGSEYAAVIIPMLTQHYAMLQRNRGPDMSKWQDEKDERNKRALAMSALWP